MILQIMLRFIRYFDNSTCLLIFLHFRYCEAFPAIRGAIQRILREEKRVKHQNVDTTSSKTKREESTRTTRSTKDFTLQRRLSTATTVKYDMYLMNLGTMLKHFGSASDRKKNFDLCHQELLKKRKLTRYEDLPLGTFVIFVSHQWNSFNHPDPNGRQMQVLSKILRDLRDGRYKTETDPFHVLVYKDNTITSAREWSELLTNAYIWYDWFSQPQPSRGSSEDEVAKLSRDLTLALDSCS